MANSNNAIIAELLHGACADSIHDFGISKTKAIKKGVTEYVLRSQDLSTYDDAIDKFKGWVKGLI
jgi:hypothetical protein